MINKRGIEKRLWFFEARSQASKYDKIHPANSQWGCVGMNPGVTADGQYSLKNESLVASEVGIDASRECANWGSEFMDDALRFREQSFPGSDDRPAEIGRR